MTLSAAAPARRHDRTIAERTALGAQDRLERSHVRRDIQGLRALAVLLVIGDHVLGLPSGGFVGVDVFFVISGFLITGLLVREHRSTGRIDLLDFYRRRVKRTVPVAWFVVVVSLAVGAAVLSSYGFWQLLRAALGAVAFWSNWQLIDVGTDYLHAADAPVALQHYWSLAVEEQFYLVWPALLILAFAGARRAGLPRLPMLVLGVAAIASVVWAAVETALHPTAAYFSSFTRAWELLAGGALAFAAPAVQRLPRRVRPVLRWGGLLVLAATACLVSPQSSFPFPWAGAAVAGTVLVIAAGIGDETASIWPLTSPVAQYLGRISYSLYLWHFPVVTFSAVFHPAAGRVVLLLELVLILALSVTSYHLLEVPLRRASWRRWSPPRPSTRGVLRAVAGLAVVLVASAGLVLSKQSSAAQAVGTTGYFPSSPTVLQAARSEQIDTALSEPAWPPLVPSDVQLRTDARVDELLKDGCLIGYTVPMTSQRCAFGAAGAPRTALIYGDSIALSYTPAVRSALEGRGWRVRTMTRMQCPAIDIPVDLNDGRANSPCDAFHRAAMRWIDAEHPDLVLAVSSHLSLNRLRSGAKGSAAMAEWTDRTSATLSRLSDSAGRVVLLDGPPLEAPTQTCKTPSSSPRDCASSVAPDWKQAVTAQRAGTRRAAESNVSYPSTLPWFCRSDGLCPSFVDGVVTLADGEHLTEEGARQLGPLMREALLPGGDPAG